MITLRFYIFFKLFVQSFRNLYFKFVSIAVNLLLLKGEQWPCSILDDDEPGKLFALPNREICSRAD